VGFGEESLQLLNRWITEHRIPYPVHPSDEDTIDSAARGTKVLFQSMVPSLDQKEYGTKPVVLTIKHFQRVGLKIFFVASKTSSAEIVLMQESSLHEYS